jgi:thymidine phosphorylase
VTGSIVSKKAAETLVALVLDIKVGRAAFMQTEAEATELARSMVEAGNGFGITTSAILSSMDAPLGRMIGNALEVRESIEVLTGTGHDDLVELVCCLGGMLLDSTGVSADQTEGRKMIQEALRNGTAHEKFIDMVTAQGGDLSCDLPRARHQSMLQSLSSGFVESIDALALAHLTLDLGAGRKELGAEIDHAVGIELRVDVGDSVDVGDHWCVIHSSQELNRDQIDTVAAALTLTKLPLESESRIIKHIH